MIVLRAPAKVNLYLEIGPRRTDGYHALKSLMGRLTLADELKIESLKKSSRAVDLKICFDRDYPRPCREDLLKNKKNNLALKAWRLLAEEYPQVKRRPVRLTLMKKIPVGAGLGGGSSDGASALIGLAQIHGLYLTKQQLFRLGLGLGSDAVFFLRTSPDMFARSESLAWVTGRGQRVRPLKTTKKFSLLVVYPGFAVSSAQAYRTLDLQAGVHLTKKKILPTLLVKELMNPGKPFRLLGYNSFEQVALGKYGILKNMKACLMALGASGVSLTGSGSSIWVLGSRDQCRRWARLISQKFSSAVCYVTTIG